jgi:hypothetical protein
VVPPGHCAPIEYSRGSFSARVGRAVASHSDRLSSVADHGKREMRSYAPQVLRTTLKQTPVHPPGLNGRPTASRFFDKSVAWVPCRDCNYSCRYFQAREAEAPRDRDPARLGCSCRDAATLCGGAMGLDLLLTKVVATSHFMTRRPGGVRDRLA